MLDRDRIERRSSQFTRAPLQVSAGDGDGGRGVRGECDLYRHHALGDRTEVDSQAGLLGIRPQQTSAPRWAAVPLLYAFSKTLAGMPAIRGEVPPQSPVP